jgi:hypothetical protein
MTDSLKLDAILKLLEVKHEIKELFRENADLLSDIRSRPDGISYSSIIELASNITDNISARAGNFSGHPPAPQLDQMRRGTLANFNLNLSKNVETTNSTAESIVPIDNSKSSSKVEFVETSIKVEKATNQTKDIFSAQKRQKVDISTYFSSESENEDDE